ncbi:beta-1,6-N-acetylglucosaminyltransferase [Thalassotalea sp. M1531]|uniref:Peptide O-xylosyltransferase n=1 Tax=Thalassotalea algicola TaxID=2716224 RepID=A0A7Y0L9I5_9GAMM|nr:beta-1,6-N-acetylglucosaminyltransferase [Thalassotalea algicola]NMP30448.1 beta-1,6-N-acetylglucosaminyltransferase [Thalassotalea algicola]
MQLKIAFLCLAHNNFDFIDKLSHYYCSDDDRLFLHVDSQVNDADIKLTNQDIYVLPKESRHRTRWGSYNIVKATLELLKAALATNQYDRFILISGADTPLLPKQTLKAKLKADISYFSHWKTASTSDSQDNREFFRRHYYLSSLTNPGEAYLTKSKLKIYIMLLLNKFIATLPQTTPFSFEHYIKGSQWWVMTNELASYISKEFTNETISNQFKSMHAPDEKAIQTIAFNSPFLDKIEFDKGQDSLKQGLHYIDWGFADKSYQLQEFSPKIIEKAKTLGCAFARKVPSDKQGEFIKFIENF